MNFKGIFFILLSTLICQMVLAKSAEDLSGEWKAIDDRSGYAMVRVKIVKKNKNQYDGYVLEAFAIPNTHRTYNLNKAKGFHVLRNLVQDSNDPYLLKSAQIVDPVTHQRFYVQGKLNRNGNHMFLRHPSSEKHFGRKIAWVRIK